MNLFSQEVLSWPEMMTFIDINAKVCLLVFKLCSPSEMCTQFCLNVCMFQ